MLYIADILGSLVLSKFDLKLRDVAADGRKTTIDLSHLAFRQTRIDILVMLLDTKSEVTFAILLPNKVLLINWLPV